MYSNIGLVTLLYYVVVNSSYKFGMRKGPCKRSRVIFRARIGRPWCILHISSFSLNLITQAQTKDFFRNPFFLLNGMSVVKLSNLDNKRQNPRTLFSNILPLLNMLHFHDSYNKTLWPKSLLSEISASPSSALYPHTVQQLLLWDFA